MRVRLSKVQKQQEATVLCRVLLDADVIEAEPTNTHKRGRDKKVCLGFSRPRVNKLVGEC